MKKAAVINDLSGLGRCSLTVSVPILSALGIQACPLPTAILTNQTDYGSYWIDDYTDNIDKFISHWKALNFKPDGICTGFLANTAQVEKIKDFINFFKCENTVLLVDPVMADSGEMYSSYSKALCEKVYELSRFADVLTPNLTELCILSNMDYHKFIKQENSIYYLEDIISLTKKLICSESQTIVVTGIIHKAPDDECDMIYNAVVSKSSCEFIKAPKLAGRFSGTGDILAAIVCGCLVNGFSVISAVKKAVSFISEAIKQTESDNPNDGIEFEKCLGLLLEEKI